MVNKKSFLISMLFILISSVSYSVETDTVTVVASGRAKITGQIITSNKIDSNDLYINITVPGPVSGRKMEYNVLVDVSGKFAVEVDLETNISLFVFNVGLDPDEYLVARLYNEKVTHLEITYDSDNKIKDLKVTPEMNSYDVTEMYNIIGEVLQYSTSDSRLNLYNKSIDEFLRFFKTNTAKRLAIVNYNVLISDALKKNLAKEIEMFLYKNFMFDYKQIMSDNYTMINNVEKVDESKIQKIDKSYFRFLKDFNLNDSQNLLALAFSEFQLAILQNETLDIPQIGDLDIPSWLAKVKLILADAVGFKEGLYFDVLVANAYGRQLNEQAIPLTALQVMNIRSYWKDSGIAEILLKRNQEVAALYNVKNSAVINDVSGIEPSQVMSTIFSKYKGKAIFVDLWATWCGPCLEAMEQFKETKGKFFGKNIVFVYLSNPSSPVKLWEEKIIGIGNEQYYLSGEQWEYVMNFYNLKMIPSYILFDKEGKLVNKFTAFPGAIKMEELINKLL